MSRTRTGSSGCCLKAAARLVSGPSASTVSAGPPAASAASACSAMKFEAADGSYCGAEKHTSTGQVNAGTPAAHNKRGLPTGIPSHGGATSRSHGGGHQPAPAWTGRSGSRNSPRSSVAASTSQSRISGRPTFSQS